MGDAGTTEAGRLYFVMEYVRGMSITRYCDEQKLDIERRLKLFKEVCEGIHHAHQKGIIHRDLKPYNILISRHGDRIVPKIIDFGIAKFADVKLTATGQILGTPHYMSPEQWRGTALDTRTDLWALGCLFYELLAGRRAFLGEDLGEVALAVLNDTPAVLPEKGAGGYSLAEATALIESLLEKDPEARCPDCTSLLAALGRLGNTA